MTNAATKWADARRREVITKIESMQRNGPASISQLQWADCELLLAALRAAPAAEIPREPTQAMIDAAFVVYDGMRPGSFSAEMTRMWRAMHDAAINGPTACSVRAASPSPEGVGSAGSGAAPIEGLADAIAELSAYLLAWEAPMPGSYANAKHHNNIRTVITAASAYQEAAAELARVKGERDADAKDAARWRLFVQMPVGDAIIAMERSRDRLGIGDQALVAVIDAALTPTAKEQT